MSALISGLDNYTPKQLGENAHIEYGWSNNYKEQIVQFQFQLTRTAKQNMDLLKHKFNMLITNIKGEYNNDKMTKATYVEFIVILYKIIASTRDIVAGKGEYSLAYMLLLVWHKHFPKLAKKMLTCFVELNDGTEHPYGSWKDIKYFAELCREDDYYHPLIHDCIQIINQRLKKDDKLQAEEMSLAAKWTPREKSHFGWMYDMLAVDYFSQYIPDNREQHPNYNKAILKCKTHYRILISALNKKLDTVQIAQCANKWATIIPEKQTSITMKRQGKAFLNTTKKGEQRFKTKDRVECANHFRAFIEKASKGNAKVNGKRLGLNEFVAEAIRISDPVLKDLLDAQWIDNATQNVALDKIIPMADVSGSMNGDPLHSAIALSIRVSEKSIFKDRIMTFSNQPSWINLSGITSFVDKVRRVQEADWGMNTNFHSAMRLILDIIVEQKMKPEDVSGMVLAIFSDMQMDQAQAGSQQTALYDSIKAMYAEAGLRVWNEPYEPPHILFWNLRSTNGFPVISSQPNASMMSGFSPMLLNQFCENGIDAFKSPWDMFISTLTNPRYSMLETHVNDFFTD